MVLQISVYDIDSQNILRCGFTTKTERPPVSTAAKKESIWSAFWRQKQLVPIFEPAGENNEEGPYSLKKIEAGGIRMGSMSGKGNRSRKHCILKCTEGVF